MQSGRFIYVYYKIFKKKLKKKLRYNKKINNKVYVWAKIKFNYPISKKGKNARMGKGIGSFIFWSFKFIKNHRLLFFANISILGVLFLKRSLRKITNYEYGVC